MQTFDVVSDKVALAEFILAKFMQEIDICGVIMTY